MPELNVVEDGGSGVAPAVGQLQVEPEDVQPKLVTLEAALQSMDGVGTRRTSRPWQRR